jgi:murein DD-endopeptidase MepM/ murein hydrolase activator NlpD
LLERNPEATKQIEQIVQQSKELDIPITPDIKRADINAPLIKVLHNHNPKPFSYPFSSRYRLSSYFGIRNLQYRGASLKKHCGIDIAAPRGTPILALTDGVVKMQFNHKFGGKSVIIEANQSHQGKRVRYSACHMQNFNRDLREGSRYLKGKQSLDM